MVLNSNSITDSISREQHLPGNLGLRIQIIVLLCGSSGGTVEAKERHPHDGIHVGIK